MEMSGQLHAATDLPPGKSPRYLLLSRLDGQQSRSGWGGEEKKSITALPGIEFWSSSPQHSHCIDWATDR
jgi:hypothetical protein